MATLTIAKDTQPQISSIIIANNYEDGVLTLIISDDRLEAEDEGQAGIEFKIPSPGKDVRIVVGPGWALEVSRKDGDD